MFLKLFSKTPKPPSDLELVQRYQETGDLAYIGELFERYTEIVFLVCRKYLPDEDSSKDATMQVFEQLIQSLKKHQITNFKSWLHVTAKNHCLMQLRAQKSKPTFSLDAEPNLHVQFSNSLHHSNGETEAREQEWQLLEKALDGLPPEQRFCLELFYLQEKSYSQIAEQTGYDVNRVRSYIQNGRRNLKIYVEKHHDAT
ncbi:sigma-70 family RNA polymerase sigma factor [Adhaeribacter swui]|uniref:Sigma-70 family RNA polymerase sigma factor n=1 Tax=Adhaeribacter swui TaxID=2086471 RepID=A0A7G7G6E2_9BACT|nr:sigma-70 family RNA polymerase sigma factor [Adhaeribacter swui]QNF32726.1 sigma-70 family RNA polymerase sigma factor [Adhaeribacter swui]